MEQMHKITSISGIKLPSINQKFNLNRKTGQLFANKEYKDFKDTIFYQALSHKMTFRIADNNIKIEIHMRTYLDIDNILKPLIDGICEGMGVNDKNVNYLVVTKTPCKKNELSAIEAWIGNI
jgi:Holliday junction resolvase RusA-like endonuclease